MSSPPPEPWETEHSPLERDLRYVDLKEAMKTGPIPVEWHIPDVIPKGSHSVAVVAPSGTGKSLLGIEWAMHIAHKGTRVMYLDLENSLSLVLNRLHSFGFTPDDIPDSLVLSVLGDWPPLDTSDGGDFLLREATSRNIDVLFIDTIGAVTAKDENSSDTYRQMAKFALVPLRRAGITIVRFDHTGKVTEGSPKSARGSSGKRTDVELEFMMSVSDSTVSLKQSKDRLGADSAVLIQYERKLSPLRHERVPDGQVNFDIVKKHDRVETIVEILDQFNVSDDAGRSVCQEVLREAGKKAGTDTLAAAIKIRKKRLPNQADLT